MGVFLWQMLNKIFVSFLVLLATAILLLLPVADGIRDFVAPFQDQDYTSVTTAGGVTTANVTLTDSLYVNKYQYTEIASTLETDTPSAISYNSTTRGLAITGLTESETRDLTVSYRVYTLSQGSAQEKFSDYVPFFWFLVCFSFPAVSIIVIIRS